MSMERLRADLAALSAGLAALARRASDNPPENASALAQALADAADSMTGWASEARESLGPSAQDRGSVQLLGVHRRALQVAAEMDDWLSYERVADVVAVGAEGGTRGREWSIDVRDALDACRHALTRVERRVFATWLELSEAGLSRGVSVQAVSVGQHVTLPPDRTVAGSDPATTGGENGGAGFQ